MTKNLMLMADSRLVTEQKSVVSYQCKHEKVLTYELQASDQADFCRRLESVLKRVKSFESGEFGSNNFLTPNMRGERAKSMAAYSRPSKDAMATTQDDSQHHAEMSQEDLLKSIQKQRSSLKQQLQIGGAQGMTIPTAFHNCEDCGSFYVNADIVAVKPHQYYFHVEILPAKLVCTLFELQATREKVMYMDDPNLNQSQDLYLSGRKRIIDGVYKMGVKFRQARETIHLAIEMIDYFYLKMSQEMAHRILKAKLMSPGVVMLYQVTVLLIASKHEEIDDNIMSISNLQDYVKKQMVSQYRRDSHLIPSFSQVVECERKLLNFFKWDLKFILPLQMLRSYLANGVLFSNEFNQLSADLTLQKVDKLKSDWSRTITTESLSISDLVISKSNVTHRRECSSDIAAGIIYLARKNILEADSPTGKLQVPHIWPNELIMLTRCSESRAQRILRDILQPIGQNIHKEDTTPLASARTSECRIISLTGSKSKLLKSSSLNSPLQNSLPGKKQMLSGPHTMRNSNMNTDAKLAEYSALESKTSSTAKKLTMQQISERVLSSQRVAEHNSTVAQTALIQSLPEVGETDEEDPSNVVKPEILSASKDTTSKVSLLARRLNVKPVPQKLVKTGSNETNNNKNKESLVDSQMPLPMTMNKAQSQRVLPALSTSAKLNLLKVTTEIVEEAQQPSITIADNLKLVTNPKTAPLTPLCEPSEPTSATNPYQRCRISAHKRSQAATQKIMEPEILHTSTAAVNYAIVSAKEEGSKRCEANENSSKKHLGRNQNNSNNLIRSTQQSIPFNASSTLPYKSQNQEFQEASKQFLASTIEEIPVTQKQQLAAVKNKKTSTTKQKYLEIKRAQIAAKKLAAVQASQNGSKPAGQQLFNGTTSNEPQNKTAALTQRHVSKKANCLLIEEDVTKSRRDSSSGAAPAGGIQLYKSKSKIQKQPSMNSQVSNDYFAMDSGSMGTQVMVEKSSSLIGDIIRSSSIEYEMCQKYTSNLPEATKAIRRQTQNNSQTRWPITDNNNRSGSSSNLKVNGQIKSLSLCKLNSSIPTSKRNSNAPSSAVQPQLKLLKPSFIKLQKQDIVMPNSAQVQKESTLAYNQKSAQVLNTEEPLSGCVSELRMMENSLESQDFPASQLRERPSIAANNSCMTQTLPSLGSKAQQMVHQQATAEGVTFSKHLDFSQAVDRLVSKQPAIGLPGCSDNPIAVTEKQPLTGRTSNAKLPVTSTKGSGTARSGKKESTKLQGASLLKKHQALSMRHQLKKQNSSGEISTTMPVQQPQRLGRNINVGMKTPNAIGIQSFSKASLKLPSSVAVKHQSQGYGTRLSQQEAQAAGQQKSGVAFRKGTHFNKLQQNCLTSPPSIQIEISGAGAVKQSGAVFSNNYKTVSNHYISSALQATTRSSSSKLNEKSLRLGQSQSNLLNSSQRFLTNISNGCKNTIGGGSSSTLKQLAADEALTNLKQHYGSFNKMMLVNPSTASKTNITKTPRDSTQSSNRVGQGSISHRQSLIQPTHQRNTRNATIIDKYHGKAALQQTSNASSKLMLSQDQSHTLAQSTVDQSNKVTSFLGKHQKVKQMHLGGHGRSVENLNFISTASVHTTKITSNQNLRFTTVKKQQGS